MKKKINLVLVLAAVSLLFSCGQNGSSTNTTNTTTVAPTTTATPTTNSPTSTPVEQFPSIKEVIANLALERNYTYEMVDEIFDVTTTMRFIPNAFYYHPSQFEHGGDDYGYAQSNDRQVFEYVIENGEVVPDEVVRSKNGDIKTDLWKDTIISFYDFHVAALPSIPTANNTYEITDDANKTLFAGLAGYADVFALPYITIQVEVLSEKSFRSILHFAPDNPAYTGNVIGTVKDIGTTTIPEIEAYLAAGLGPKESTSTDVIELLTKLKNSKKYQIDVVTSTKHYIDLYHDDYYYSYDSLATGSEKGYFGLNNHIYSFKIVNGQVSINNEITYNNEDHSNIWVHNLFNSFASINLSDLAITKEDDDSFTIANNISVLGTFFNLVHSTGFFPSPNEADTVNIKLVDDSSFEFIYNRYDGSTYNCTVSNIGSASNSIVDAYLASGGDIPDANDLSRLTNKLTDLKNGKNYTLTVTEAISFPPSGFTKTGNKEIRFTENAYYLDNKTNASLSLGYAKDELGVYNFTKVDGQEVKGEYVKENDVNVQDLYGSNLFSSFISIDPTSVTGEQKLDQSFSITDSATLLSLLSIGGYDGTAIASSLTCIATVSEDVTTFKISLGSFYGSVTLAVSNIGTTTI